MADLPVNPTFNVNDFNEPKVLSPTESYITDVLMILLVDLDFIHLYHH